MKYFSLLLALLCVSATPVPPRPHLSRKAVVAPTQGAAAVYNLKALVIVPPAAYTNYLVLSWPYTNWMKLDQPFPGLVVFYDGSSNGFHRLVTNYFDIQNKTGVQSPWIVVGTTNRSPYPITTTNRQGYYRLRSYVK